MENTSQAAPDFSLSQSKWSFIGNIHPFAVIFSVILLAAVATLSAPDGSFDRHIGMTREVIITGSYQPVDSVPQGFVEIWTSFMQGTVEASDIIFTIFLCAGTLTAIIHTGAVTTFIHAIVNSLKGNAVPVMLVMVPLMLMMGFDSALAVMIVHLGCVVGSSACFSNPFAVGIGQALAEVLMTSGIGVRVILWFFMTAGTVIYINMRNSISQFSGLQELICTAYQKTGHTPKVLPIRGGTDGAMSAVRGLAAPNLFIGGHNYHRELEYVSVDVMALSSQVLSHCFELSRRDALA